MTATEIYDWANQFFLVFLFCFLMYHFLEWFERTTGDYFTRLGERLATKIKDRFGEH